MATNIFSLAKTIRDKHPRMSVQASVQKAGKQIRAEKKAAVSGVKRKSVGKTKKTIGKTKRSIGKKVGRVASVRVGGTKRKAAVGGYEKGLAIHKKIDTLEAKYKGETRKELKEILRLAINAEHDKLDDLKRAYKKVR